MPTEDNQRIWVVDDDRSVRFVLATALRDAGYDVDGFDSAASALQALGTRGVPTCCSPTCACRAKTGSSCSTGSSMPIRSCR